MNEDENKNLFKNVGKRLKKWSRDIKNERLNNIAEITKNAMMDLGQNYFDLPEKFISRIRNYEREEGALQSLSDYRDHFIHTFHVFLLGYCILDKWMNDGKNPLNLTENDLKKWFIASIYHDVGVPASKIEILFETIAISGGRIKKQLDWSPILLNNKYNIYHVEELSKLFAKKSQIESDKSQMEDNILLFKRWFYTQLLETHDHGTLTSIWLLNQNDQDEDYTEAALAIALHNYRRKKNSTNLDIGQLSVEKFPLAFLLTYCDLAQEWGRNILLERLDELGLDKLGGDDYKKALKILNKRKLKDPVPDLPDTMNHKIETHIRIGYESPSDKIGKKSLKDILTDISNEFESTWYLENQNKIDFCIVCLDSYGRYICNIYPGEKKEIDDIQKIKDEIKDFIPEFLKFVENDPQKFRQIIEILAKKEEGMDIFSNIIKEEKSILNEELKKELEDILEDK